jgi:hypothetical protein
VRDGAHAAFSGQDVLPGFIRAYAEGADQADPRRDNSPRQALSLLSNLTARAHFAALP